MTPDVQRCIFATNAFASQHPEEHIKLWKEFEQQVPQSQRIGYYGIDNVSYIKWLQSTKNTAFLSFLQSQIQGKQYNI